MDFPKNLPGHVRSPEQVTHYWYASKVGGGDLAAHEQVQARADRLTEFDAEIADCDKKLTAAWTIDGYSTKVALVAARDAYAADDRADVLLAALVQARQQDLHDFMKVMVPPASIGECPPQVLDVLQRATAGDPEYAPAWRQAGEARMVAMIAANREALRERLLAEAESL